MQTINYDFAQLLKKVKADHFLIPQFQRDFTWKDGQSKLLIDSIARNYPIGSLLVLGKNDEIPLKSRSLNAEYPPSHDINCNDCDEKEPTPDSYYVLDGQQRLTSIARIFIDAHPKKNYYFDLNKMHIEFDSENASWVVSRQRRKKNPERKDNNRLIRSDIVLDQKKCDVYISEYIEDSGDFPEFKNNKNTAREAAAKIKGVFETIRKYLLTFIVLSNDAPLESVCRVFETINSTGTRLTTFDLAVARYYPEPDLKYLYDTSKEKHPILQEFEVDGERLLQILALYKLTIDGKFPEATRKVMLSMSSDYIKLKWDEASCCLAKIYQWVKHQGATTKTQPPHGLIVSIATILMFYPEALSENKLPHIFKKWYFCSILAKSPSPQTNYKIGDDFKKFKEYLDDEKSIPYPLVYFSKKDIIDIKRISDSRYKAIQNLFKTTAKEDMITGNKLEPNAEDHHIFPYSLSKLSGFNKNKINSIVNRIIVSKKTNRSINNTNPIKYLGVLADKHLKEGNAGDLNRRLKNCFIPYDCSEDDFKTKISNDNFDNFLLDRAVIIIDRIKEVVGDSWKKPQQMDI